MKTMARIGFPVEDAELGITALRNAGYEVLSHVYAEEPDYTFIEAYRDTDDSSDIELTRVSAIVDPLNGWVDDAGPIPPGHIPFEYEGPVWKPDLSLQH